MKNGILAVSCLTIACTMYVAFAEDCTIKSVFREWHPTGMLRLNNGDIEQEYVKISGCNGQRDARIREYEFRKVENAKPEDALKTEFQGITLTLTDWQPTANLRKNHGTIERQFERRVNHGGARDANVSEYKWEPIQTADRMIASTQDRTPASGIESTLVGWHATGEVRKVGGKYQQKYARTVGYNGQQDSRVNQYEWRDTQ